MPNMRLPTYKLQNHRDVKAGLGKYFLLYGDSSRRARGNPPIGRTVFGLIQWHGGDPAEADCRDAV
jgi:hypothetical protein